MRRLYLGILTGALASLAVVIMSGCGGDTTYTQEAELPPEVPSNGTAIVIEGEDNGLSYTNVSDNSILVSCGDDCNLTVNEVAKVEDEDDNETEEE